MRSIIPNHIFSAVFWALSLLAVPAFAASDGSKTDDVNNLYNYALGAGSIVFVLVGIWVLRSNMKRGPGGGK